MKLRTDKKLKDFFTYFVALYFLFTIIIFFLTGFIFCEDCGNNILGRFFIGIISFFYVFVIIQQIITGNLSDVTVLHLKMHLLVFPLALIGSVIIFFIYRKKIDNNTRK